MFFKDTDASIISNGDYHRIIYQESQSVEVVLDVTKHEMSLKRQGEWLTHGLFSPDSESFLLIRNELGSLKFEIQIENFEYDNNSVFIEYHLLEKDKKTTRHEFKCSWNRRN